MIRVNTSLTFREMAQGAAVLWMALGWLSFSPADTWDIELDYPSFQGDFYAVGTVAFPPGSVRSEDQVRVQLSESREEISTCIKGVQTWPDGSLRRAEIVFPANSSRPAAHRLIFGEGVKRGRAFPEPAVLPTVAFSVRGAPRVAETMDVSVGTINIRVDRSPRIYYYWHLAPIFLLIVLAGYRARRTGSAP